MIGNSYVMSRDTSGLEFLGGMLLLRSHENMEPIHSILVSVTDSRSVTNSLPDKDRVHEKAFNTGRENCENSLF